MILINALEAICDLLPYFALSTLFKQYQNSGVVIGAVLLLVFISSLIMGKFNNTAVRILCGILPALGLLLANNQSQLMFTMPALVLWCMLVYSEKNNVHYDDYKYWYGVPAALALLIMLINLSHILAGEMTNVLSILCASTYLGLGIIILRRKRMGAGISTGVKLLNIAEIIAALSCGILSCALVTVILKAIWKFVEIILLPFGLIINALVNLFSLFSKVIDVEEAVEEASASESSSLPEEEIAEMEHLISHVTPKDYTGAEIALRLVLYILTLAAFIFVCYLIYGIIQAIRSAGNGGNVQYDYSAQEKISFGKNRKKERRKHSVTNNDKIRDIYREYLSYIKLKGIKIVEQTTSEEILVASRQLADSEEAAKLRALYIRARYNDEKQLSNEDVNLARELWHTIREEYEAKEQ